MAGYVYIVQRADGKLTTGVVAELELAAAKMDRLLYFEELDQLEDAIAVERMIKGWTRRKKMELISKRNPKSKGYGSGLF